MLKYILAVLAVGVAVLHGYVGRMEVLLPALAQVDWSLGIVLAACWHFITAFFVVSAVAFARGDAEVTRFGALWTVFGIIFIAVGLVQGGFQGLLAAPQWALLLPIGLGALWLGRTGQVSARN